MGKRSVATTIIPDNPEEPYECPICTEQYSRPYGWCNYDSKRSAVRYLRIHMSMHAHTTREHSTISSSTHATKCDYNAKSNGGVRNNLTWERANAVVPVECHTPYKCPMCTHGHNKPGWSGFPSRGHAIMNLFRHLKTHTDKDEDMCRSHIPPFEPKSSQHRKCGQAHKRRHPVTVLESDSSYYSDDSLYSETTTSETETESESEDEEMATNTRTRITHDAPNECSPSETTWGDTVPREKNTPYECPLNPTAPSNQLQSTPTAVQCVTSSRTPKPETTMDHDVEVDINPLEPFNNQAYIQDDKSKIPSTIGSQENDDQRKSESNHLLYEKAKAVVPFESNIPYKCPLCTNYKKSGWSEYASRKNAFTSLYCHLQHQHSESYADVHRSSIPPFQQKSAQKRKRSSRQNQQPLQAKSTSTPTENDTDYYSSECEGDPLSKEKAALRPGTGMFLSPEADGPQSEMGNSSKQADKNQSSAGKQQGWDGCASPSTLLGNTCNANGIPLARCNSASTECKLPISPQATAKNTTAAYETAKALVPTEKDEPYTCPLCTTYNRRGWSNYASRYSAIVSLKIHLQNVHKSQTTTHIHSKAYNTKTTLSDKVAMLNAVLLPPVHVAGAPCLDQPTYHSVAQSEKQGGCEFTVSTDDPH